MTKAKLYLIGLVLFLGLIASNLCLHQSIQRYKNLKLNLDESSLRIDSLTYENEMSVISIKYWKQMNDSNSMRIKELQKKLDIKDKDLNSAGRIIASLKDTNELLRNTIKADTLYVDSLIYVHVDSLSYSYNDQWTSITVTGDLDSLRFSYESSTNLDVITYIGYKPSSTKFGRWWNRLWKRGKHESVVIESDNPHLEINQIKWTKITQ